jgi:hypothetical protein
MIRPEKNNEWYTPPVYIEAARRVMGSIELDPASCEQANRVVKAERYYTLEDNGLQQDWTCKSLWLNPPYGRIKSELTGSIHSHQMLFAEKLQQSYECGKVNQAVLLSLGNPGSVWFQPFFSYLIGFHCGHIKFHRPDGTIGQFGFPLAFVYLGPHESRFIEEFQQFGVVVKRVSKSQPKIFTSSLWT